MSAAMEIALWEGDVPPTTPILAMLEVELIQAALDPELKSHQLVEVVFHVPVPF